jgi:DNA-binding NarL/FixJ family response regulator
MAIRVVLADDNALFRGGLASLLSQSDAVKVVGQATNTDEVVWRASKLRPDVVLMDLAMPGGGGVAATRQILAERPGQIICMLTTSTQEADLFAAIRAGARGYLAKTVELPVLCSGLRALVAGGSVVTPQLATELLAEFGRLAPGGRERPRDLETLTARERQVLELVAYGSSNNDIGRQLVIAENTVKVHVRNIIDKLKLRNRQHAAAFAVQAGQVRDVRAEVA